MAMRMSGMMSGLDTESIIQQLVAARQTKVDTQKKAQTKLNWKQEAWKELNDKLKKLQTKFVSSMRFSSAYSKKVTKVSNSNAVSVITGENAVNGVQSLEIEQLAKTGYLTGGQIGGGKQGFTALSKLGDIDKSITGDGTINITTGDRSVEIKVTGETTISDILTQVKNAGLNASFDEKWQRINISSKESGKANDFSITATDAVGAVVLSALGIQTDLTKDTVTMDEYKEYAGYYVAGDRTATLNKMKSLIDNEVETRKNSYMDQYKSLQESIIAANETINKIKEKYKNDPNGSLSKTSSQYEAELDSVKEKIAQKKSQIEGITDPALKEQAETELEALEKQAEDLKARQADAKTVEDQENNLADYGKKLADIEFYVDGTTGTVKDTLQKEVEDRYYNKAKFAADVIDGTVTLQSSGATKTAGEEAVIFLNGARYENNTNTFEINGLTFTALSETKGESVTVTTEQDTDGIYDMVKNFLKEYNEIVNEMDKLYNADAAKGYEPLTDEEKETMSEKEIEKWETKIKDSILRRDDNLSSVNSALQSIMAGGVEVNGKMMYLYDFGIDTLGYFNAADNEKHAYHIDGDPDDDFTSGNADKLKGMIANDPDTVISFFSKLTSNLYDKMFDMSKSVDGYRSFGNFYDDKKMKSDYDSYTSKIKQMEVKLTEYEDKWYAKFSKMETALAKMQSNMSAVTSLLGG